MKTAILCDQAGHIYAPFLLIRPSSGPEGPVNQADKPTGFLLPLTAGLRIPGCQANYSAPYWPWKSQAPRQPGGGDCRGTGKCSSTHSSYKIKLFQVLSDELGLELLLDTEPCDHQWPGSPPLTSASSEDQVTCTLSYDFQV